MNPPNCIRDTSRRFCVTNCRPGQGRLRNSLHKLAQIGPSLVASWKVPRPAVHVGPCTAAPEISGVSA